MRRMDNIRLVMSSSADGRRNAYEKMDVQAYFEKTALLGGLRVVPTELEIEGDLMNLTTPPTPMSHRGLNAYLGILTKPPHLPFPPSLSPHDAVGLRIARTIVWCDELRGCQMQHRHSTVEDGQRFKRHACYSVAFTAILHSPWFSYGPLDVASELSRYI